VHSTPEHVSAPSIAAGLEPCEFGLSHYRAILEKAIALGYRPLGFRDVLANESGWTLLLRHDVDVSLDDALAMAELEAEVGARATYFIRVHARGYNPFSRSSYRALRRMLALGFEIGLHHEVGVFPDDSRSAKEFLLAEKVVLESVTGRPVAGVATHLPKWVTSTLDRDTLADCGFAYEAGDERFRAGAKFLSDSNRNLRFGCPCQFVGQVTKIYLAVHPYWWVNADAEPSQVIASLRAGD